MSEPLHPLQLAGLRRMQPARKIELLCELYQAGVALRVAGLRQQYPDRPRELSGMFYCIIRVILAVTRLDRTMIDQEVAQRGLSHEWRACTG